VACLSPMSSRRTAPQHPKDVTFDEDIDTISGHWHRRRAFSVVVPPTAPGRDLRAFAETPHRPRILTNH